jgi:hypothetical protein
MSGMYWGLLNRAERRATSPNLSGLGTTTHWWHHASEFLTDGAMAIAIHYKPPEALTAWLRSTTLSIVRRPMSDWIGPAFRNHTHNPPMGHLETAHLAWSVAIVLDLAGHIFSGAERDEIDSTLRVKGLAPCQAWIDHNRVAANWRCILNAGVAVTAVVINDVEAMTRAASVYAECSDFFQPDGSYAESIQYGNYAMYGMVLAREALVRRDPSLGAQLPLGAAYRKPSWDAAALLYRKPLSGWGSTPLARSANFNDSAAIYRASADVLLHTAACAKERYPIEAGLARWLFETLYLPIVDDGHHDQASFGFVNDFGFLSLLTWPDAASANSPTDTRLPLTTGFTCGDAFARDAWDGRTILAMRTGTEPLYASGHGHGDFNSFILAHNQERLLVDPGHSCYRNVTHELETSTEMHNTCTFIDSCGGLIKQRVARKRRQVGESPWHDGVRRLLLARSGDVSVIASDAAVVYGPPIHEFTRTWILCGSHVLFLVDRTRASAPVRTQWNFLLNNRDGMLDLKQPAIDRLVARRGTAAMKLFHLGSAKASGPFYALVHDAYHPQPNELGEGHTGSGMLVRWSDPKPVTERTVIHAIAVDEPGRIAGWHLKVSEPDQAVLEAPGGQSVWKLSIGTDEMNIEESVAGVRHVVTQHDEWSLQS